MRFRLVAWLGLALLIAGCGSSATSPTPVRTPAEPTTTESFVGTLGVGATRFYSFSVGVYGKVNVALTALGDAEGPSSVELGLALGVPVGTACSVDPTDAVTTTAGSEVVVNRVREPGIYCARVNDAGNLANTSTFNVSIAHP